MATPDETQAAGQPPAPAPEPGQQEQRAPVQVSPEEVQQLKRMVQGLQSAIARSENRLSKVQKAIQQSRETFQKAERAGNPLPPETQARMMNTDITEILGSSEPDPFAPDAPAQASVQAAGGANPEALAINTAARTMMRRGGLSESDPEFKQINFYAATPDDFLDSVEAAVSAKKQRVAAPPVAASAPAPLQQPPRTVPLPTNLGPNAAPPPADLREQYKAEVAKALGNPQRVLDIRMKYRKQGLDI